MEADLIEVKSNIKELTKSANPFQDASLFGLVFNEQPTYEEIINRTLDLAPIFK